MTILPLIAASLIAPSQPVEAATEPAWLATAPLLATETDLGLLQQDDTYHSVPTTSRWYARVSGGWATTENSSGPGEEIDFDEGYMISLGLGHRFGASDTGLGFAAELDGIWTDQEADDNPAVRDLNVLGVLIDGVIDYRIADVFTIYGALGVGAAWLDVGNSSDSLSDFEDEDGPFLAWQAKAGVMWHLGETTALHAGYRFLNVDDAEMDDGLSDSSFGLETQQHILGLGLVFVF